MIIKQSEHEQACYEDIKIKDVRHAWSSEQAYAWVFKHKDGQMQNSDNENEPRTIVPLCTKELSSHTACYPPLNVNIT